jgi:hypothetical protein
MIIDGKITSINDKGVRIEDFNGNVVEYSKPEILTKPSSLFDINKCMRVYISNNSDPQYKVIAIDNIGSMTRLHLDDGSTILCHSNEFKYNDEISISFQKLDHITEPTDF